MRDREAINRFCGFFLLGWKAYKSGEMDSFLATALTGMNKLSETQLSSLRQLFDISMRLNRDIFGDHAFRKSLATADVSPRRQVLNIALFDVCSVKFAKLNQKIGANPAALTKVRRAFATLLSDKRFVTAITYSTNSTQAVATRFEMSESVLQNSLI